MLDNVVIRKSTDVETLLRFVPCTGYVVLEEDYNSDFYSVVVNNEDIPKLIETLQLHLKELENDSEA